MGFVHLHVHSQFSLLAGTAKVPELVKKAKNLGMEALALTDTNKTSGLILFYQACLQVGIKPIMGVELTDPKMESRKVVLLAKNREGYGDLCEAVSRRFLNPPQLFFSQLFERPLPNLFFITAQPDVLTELAHTPNRCNVYGELLNHHVKSRVISKELEKCAMQFQIPLVVTNDVYLENRTDWEIHKVLRAIDLNATLSFLNDADFCPRSAYFKTAQQMQKLFPSHAEALENSGKIAHACQVHFEFHRWIMPQIEVPSGYTPASYLAKLAREGLKRNYLHTPSYTKASDIQEMELQVIEKLGYSSYFLMVKDVRDWANRHFSGGYRRPRDSTILRGSAANSITFYNLEVSDLDPIRYDLYFQRFLNEDRASPPDADLDFGWDEREEVLNYVSERFGENRVAITCTFQHFRRRGSFREVAKVHGYSEEEVSHILESYQTQKKKIIDDHILEVWSMAEKIKGRPRFLGQHPGGLIITNEPISRYVGLERSGGEKNRIITQIDMHSGIDELGLIKFDLLGNGSLSVLRDTLQQIHQGGMPDPEVWNLEKCFGDEKVREIIACGRTRGIFYIESPAQSRLNKKCQAGTFEEITITSSLVRPAGAGYTATFVERHRKMKMGIQDWKFLHPSLEPILKETHDVFAYQEDVTKACHHVAGLSYKKADRIRKMMNSMHEGAVPPEEWKQTALEFVEGCMSTSGLSREQALKLWERVSSFQGFSFCKSHSASYAQLSFQCTYLKAYYPAQFLAAVISNEHGFYNKQVYIDESRRWGLTLLPLHINYSEVKYFGFNQYIRPGFMHVRGLPLKLAQLIVSERNRGGVYTSLENFLERVPLGKKHCENLILLGAFEGVGESGGETRPELLFRLEGYSTRKSGAFLFENNFNHLLETNPTDTAFLPLLEKKTAMDRDPILGHTQDPVQLQGQQVNSQPNGKYVSPFHRTPQSPLFAQKKHQFYDYTLMEKCLLEEQLLGYMISGDVLEILELHPSYRNAVPANQIHHYLGQRIKVFGRPVTHRLHRVSKSGKPMEFLTLEDKTEHMDVIFWPNVYEKYQDELLGHEPCEVYGKVVQDWDTYCIEADTLRAVAWSPNAVDFNLASERLARAQNKVGRYADIEQIEQKFPKWA